MRSAIAVLFGLSLVVTFLAGCGSCGNLRLDASWPSGWVVNHADSDANYARIAASRFSRYTVGVTVRCAKDGQLLWNRQKGEAAWALDRAFRSGLQSNCPFGRCQGVTLLSFLPGSVGGRDAMLLRYVTYFSREGQDSVREGETVVRHVVKVACRHGAAVFIRGSWPLAMDREISVEFDRIADSVTCR